MPNWPEPMSASPDSLSRTRRYTGGPSGSGCAGPLLLEVIANALRPSALSLPAGRCKLGRHFLGEVGFLLLHPLAQRVAGKAPDGDLLARLGRQLEHQGADVLGRILDELLIEKANVLLPFADLAVDDLG